MKKAIFLDRDGVINQAIVKEGKPYPPASLQELIIPVDVAPALQQLKQAGFLTIGVTNQPDVARGKTPRATVDSINNYLCEHLAIDTFFVCFHDDKDNCSCRKPLPGLLTQAAEAFEISLQDSFMIGDRWRDVEAGQRAGCKTIWLDCSYAEKKPLKPADFVTDSFKNAVDWILNLNSLSL